MSKVKELYCDVQTARMSDRRDDVPMPEELEPVRVESVVWLERETLLTERDWQQRWEMENNATDYAPTRVTP